MELVSVLHLHVNVWYESLRGDGIGFGDESATGVVGVVSFSGEWRDAVGPDESIVDGAAVVSADGDRRVVYVAAACDDEPAPDVLRRGVGRRAIAGQLDMSDGSTSAGRSTLTSMPRPSASSFDRSRAA